VKVVPITDRQKKYFFALRENALKCNIYMTQKEIHTFVTQMIHISMRECLHMMGFRHSILYGKK
jgi:hypothetical protein